MKIALCTFVNFLILSIAVDSYAQLPSLERAKYSDAEYAEIMSKNHIHRRYDRYPATVPEPIRRGQVEIGTETYDQWHGPYGWYYCYPQDGECFDQKGLGVDPSGSCWVDKNHQCTSNERNRDVSYYASAFRQRGDLGPPMSISGNLALSEGYDEAELKLFCLIAFMLFLPQAVLPR